MRTEELGYIVEVYKTGSISKAAANLSMSPQGLGKALKTIEHSLCCELFTKSPQGAEPTPLCRYIYKDVVDILNRSDKLDKMIAGYGINSSEPEYIVCMASILGDMVCDALASYNELSGRNVNTVPLAVSDIETEKEFENKQYQYRIVTKELIANDVYSRFVIATLHFHPIVSVRSPLCRKISVKIKDFDGMTLLVDNKSRPYVKYFEILCKRAGISIRIKEAYEKLLVTNLLKERPEYVYLGQRSEINRIVSGDEKELVILAMDPPFQTNIVIQCRSGRIDPQLLHCIRNKLAFFSEKYLD